MCSVFESAPCFPHSEIPDPTDLRVQLREQNLYYEDQLRPVNRIIVHPNYFLAQDGADIALLELQEPANLSSHIQVINLPPRSETFPPGTPCWVTGWGDIKDDSEPRELQQDGAALNLSPRGQP